MSRSKNLKQRWLPLALVPLFSVSVLAGCGSDDDDGGGETVPETGMEEVVEPGGVVGDADGNGIPDAFETGTDANGNGIADIYETAADESFTDTNNNGVDDSYEAVLTGGADANADGVDDAAAPVTDAIGGEGDMTGGEGALTAEDQIGPVDVPLSDAGTAALSWDGFNLTGQIDIDGLAEGVGPARAALVTGIAAAGNGVELLPFNGDGNPTYFLPSPLGTAQAAAVTESILSGNLYVQVDLSDGSSRDGIILLRGVEPRFIDLNAANSVPVGDADTTGGAHFNVNTVTGDFAAVVNINLQQSDVDAEGNPETITAAHIHMGAADENGDVIVPLADAGDGSSWTATGTFTDDQLAAVLAGDTYFNVHRTDGSGIIRGQIPSF